MEITSNVKKEPDRKHYIDNLRWFCILLLIPFHASMAWNTWGEGNYIWFNENRLMSTFLVFISPWYMPLLFVIAGMSTKYALQKRSVGEFVKNRAQKLFIPMLAGIVTIVAAMAYYADRFNCGYSGGFISHYKVFFTRLTDLTGYDGGFSPGHLWFLLYLFVISMIAVGIIVLQKKLMSRLSFKNINIIAVMALGIIPVITSDILSFGGKSLGSYMFLYLSGYYVFAEDTVQEKITAHRYFCAAVATIAAIVNVVLFIWTDNSNEIINSAAMYIASWFGILIALGFGRIYFNQSNKVTKYLASRSFLFYIFHFLWLVLLQFYISPYKSNTVILYIIPMLGAYAMTFITCELVMRIPIINFLYGAAKRHKVLEHTEK